MGAGAQSADEAINRRGRRELRESNGGNDAEQNSTGVQINQRQTSTSGFVGTPLSRCHQG